MFCRHIIEFQLRENVWWPEKPVISKEWSELIIAPEPGHLKTQVENETRLYCRLCFLYVHIKIFCCNLTNVYMYMTKIYICLRVGQKSYHVLLIVIKTVNSYYLPLCNYSNYCHVMTFYCMRRTLTNKWLLKVLKICCHSTIWKRWVSIPRLSVKTKKLHWLVICMQNFRTQGIYLIVYCHLLIIIY